MVTTGQGNTPRMKLANALLAHTWQAGDKPLPPVPYLYGGWKITGWDCSGAVGYTLAGIGIRSLPGLPASWYATMPYHPGAAVNYRTWDKTWKPDNIIMGDLLVWETHMGIALTSTMMVSALDAEYGTFVSPITGWGPSGETMVVRRLLWSEYANTN